MTVDEFRKLYPFQTAGMSDDEVRKAMGPEPDPENYYFDRIIDDCHYAWTLKGSDILDVSYVLMHS